MKKIIKVISYISFLIIICILFSACNDSIIVSFDTDGGSIISEQEIKKGELAIAPDDPTKLGYEFIGWYLGNEKWDFTNEVSEDIKLVAKWNLIKPTEIRIIANARQVVVGDTIKFNIGVTPDNALPDVIWSVDKEDIASIDQNGRLTGLKEGKLVISAVSTVDEAVFAKMTISVARQTDSGINLYGYTIRIGYYDNREYELDARLVESMNPEYKSSLFSRCLARAFNEISEKYNCIIEVAGYPGINDNLIDNYIINEYKNDSSNFDIYFVPTNIIPTISQALLNIDDLYSKYGDSCISSNDLKEFSYKDKLYGWNYSVDQIQNSDYVLALNYDLLENIGMDNLEPAKLFMENKWSIDEFSEWCLTAQAKLDELASTTGQQYYVLTGHIAYYLQGLANASGIPLADVSNLTTNLAANDVVDIHDVLHSLYTSGCFDPANQEGRRIDTWNEGRALICVGQAGFVDNREKWGPDLWGEGTTLYGFVPWPYANGANHQIAKWMSYTTECFCMPKAINQKIKYAAYSSDVTAENIYKILVECYKRAYELLQSDPTYDKDEYNRFIAQGKWDSEASVNAWLYIQDNLNTKKLFDPIQELKDGSMYTWQKDLAGNFKAIAMDIDENDYAATVYPYLDKIQTLIQDRYN